MLIKHDQHYGTKKISLELLEKSKKDVEKKS